jgi:hypothetical protein
VKKAWQEMIHHHTYELDFSRADSKALPNPGGLAASDLPIADAARKRMVDDLPTILTGPVRVSKTRN